MFVTPRKRGREEARPCYGNYRRAREALFPEELAHQPECRPVVAAALNEHVENLALMIDGAPQVHAFAGDPDHHLVEVPSIARSWPTAPQLSCDPGPEFQNTAPRGFIGNLQPSLGQEILYIAIAQGEA